jgi:hypothetical protein
MKVKAGVIIQGLAPCMRKALIVCERIYHRHGTQFVITSGLDGCHSAGSLHPYGYAIDCRTRDLKSEENRIEVYEQLKSELNEYDVVLEKDHIHIENEKGFNRFIKLFN